MQDPQERKSIDTQNVILKEYLQDVLFVLDICHNLSLANTTGNSHHQVELDDNVVLIRDNANMNKVAKGELDNIYRVTTILPYVKSKDNWLWNGRSLEPFHTLTCIR